MSANLFPVQPKATRLRLVPGSESRCGSCQLLLFLQFVLQVRWPFLLGPFLFALMLLPQPASPAVIEGTGRSGEFFYNLACFTLALDSNPLWAGDESLEAVREDEDNAHPAQAVSILPAPKVSMRGKRWNPEIDWTAHWMFLLGMMLFWVSWLLAVWERGSRLYAQPLLPDEPVPAPRPPGILFTVKQAQGSKTA